MPTIFFSRLTLPALLILAACGGESPPPELPPPSPPPPVLATASVAAPPTEAPPAAPPPKPSLAEVVPRAIRTITEAIAAHDDAREDALLADDLSVYFYGSLVQGEMHGKHAVLERFKNTPFPDNKASANRIWTKGNVAVVEFTWTGTMTRDGKDLKATNRPFGQKRAVVYVFDDDGLVKEERIYADVLAMRAQMKGDRGAPAVEAQPTAATEMHVGKGTPDEDRLVEWAKKLDDAFNTGDARQPAALLADDVEYDAWGVPPLKGKKENAKDLQHFFKAFPDQKWTTTNVFGVDGFAVIEHVFTGTQKVPYGRFAKVTGKPVTGEHYLEIWQPDAGGKLLHGWAYANPVEALQQTGALEKEKPASSPAATR